MALEWRDRAALVGALVVAAGCVRLGVWQLDRLHQRRARNAVVLAQRSRSPRPVAGTLALDSARDRRLSALGAYDYAHERLWHGRSYEGVPGVDLITPLRLPDGTAVLVDRGWAPSPDGYHVDQDAYREGDSAEVLGIGVGVPRAPGDVDLAALRDSLPYPLLPFVIQLLPPSTALYRPLPPGLHLAVHGHGVRRPRDRVDRVPCAARSPRAAAGGAAEIRRSRPRLERLAPAVFRHSSVGRAADC